MTRGWLSFMAALVVVCIPLGGCGKRKPTRQDVEKPRPTYQGSAENVVLTLPDKKGRPAAAIKTRHSDQAQISGIVSLRDSYVTLFSDGKPYANVAAAAVRLDTNKRTVEMTGGVRARVLDGSSSFKVDSLQWAADTGAFTGTGNARFEAGPVSLRGDRISGRTPVTVVDLTENVRFSINSKQ